MLHRNLKNFYSSISKDSRIICIDMGEKQVGIALSDKTQLIAMAHSVYRRQNTNRDLGYLYRIMRENDSSAMVIGLPLQMNGQENEWCNKIIHFASKMAKKYQIDIYLQDEILSTFMATQVLKLTGVSITKSKQIDDKISACIILQRVLNKIKK
ncbi:MAG: Holliday junction resolvase RuvX [Wolbachia endosymbiont of Fragariocoptes setiger]|nr:Holliday junction resolvase RuvX [Wolbachia endosymbiont of Fragariocoptes setiger]